MTEWKVTGHYAGDEWVHRAEAEAKLAAAEAERWTPATRATYERRYVLLHEALNRIASLEAETEDRARQSAALLMRAVDAERESLNLSKQLETQIELVKRLTAKHDPISPLDPLERA